MKRRIVVGVTGGLGTGKTTVANIFKKFRAKIIDVDKIAKEVVSTNGPTLAAIIKCFGEDVLNKDKTLNRKRLASVVFESDDLLRKLEGITHPVIKSKIKKELNGLNGIIIIDCPLLIEAGLKNMVDITVVVSASFENQINRVKGRFPKALAKKIIQAQLPLSKKVELADYVIDNNGGLEDTEAQVEHIFEELKKRVEE
ncbi:MAG: dephospho-CoA kinase [bacterium]|nr:dephospho-CoA kinase [bacterium]